MEKNETKEKTGQPGHLNPFPGLRPFTPEESELFFGREGQSEEILAKLKKNKFVTVIGASGSGKSSLIYCGIIPRLTAGSDSSGGWKVLNLRPGNDPIGNLVDTFAGESDKNNEKQRDGLESAFRKSNKGLDEAVLSLNLKKGEQLLLMVDQFEELFRYKDAQRSGSFTSDSKQFVNLLVNAITKSPLDIHVIITMRSDFIGECAHFQGLTSLINESNYLVPHMARDNYLKVVTGPIEYAGASIDEELVDALLNEIGNRIDQLPVLQHALMRTWEHWQKLGHKDIPVSKTDYDSVGQMSEAMSRHADEAFEELDGRGKEICEVMFKTITEKGSDNKGIRHPTKIETIASIARCTPEELFNIVDVFRLSGRSFITPGPGVELTAETVIDVSHESLMRVWDRLAQWVEEEASSVQMYLRLSEASELFQAGKTSLWRPPDLQLAINWRNENKPTLTWAERYNPAFERAMVYLQTSEKEYLTEEENKIIAQKRQLRRSRITAIILGTAAIISVFFMLYAFERQIEANKQRREAEVQKQEAEVQKIKADSSALVAIQNEQRANENSLLAIANADTAKINAAIAEQQRLIAEENAIRASLSEQEARKQESIAKENEIEATRNAELAKQEEERATRLRMVSIGKTMAIKSVQATGQGDLQGLLAYQAYLFNKRNGGLENDADVYMGLYHVSKTFGGANYKSLEGHQGAVQSIAFTDNSQTFFSSGSDGKVIKWNLPGGQAQTVATANEIVGVLATSPDGGLVATGSDNAMIKVYPVEGSGMAYSLEGHTGKIKSIVFTPDNKYLYSSSLDGSLLQWDLSTKQSTSLLSEAETIVSLDISESGKYLAGATELGQVHLWNLDEDIEIDPISSEKGTITVIRFDDAGTLAIGFQNGIVELWDVEGGTVRAEIQGHNARISDISFNSAFPQMATGSTDQKVKIWNLEDLTEPPITLDDNGGYVLALSFSPDGKTIVSGADVDSDNLIVRPTRVDYMVSDICSILSRNFSVDEWRIYVGEDIVYEETCDSRDLSIKVEEKKGK